MATTEAHLKTEIRAKTPTSDPEKVEWPDNNLAVAGRCHRLGEGSDLRRQGRIWDRRRVQSLALGLLLPSLRFGGWAGWIGTESCRLRLFEV